MTGPEEDEYPEGAVRWGSGKPDEGYRSAREEFMGEMRASFAADGLGPMAIENRMNVVEEVVAMMANGGYLLVDTFVYKIGNSYKDGEGASLARWTVYTNQYEEDE